MISENLFFVASLSAFHHLARLLIQRRLSAAQFEISLSLVASCVQAEEGKIALGGPFGDPVEGGYIIFKNSTAEVKTTTNFLHS